MVKITENKKCTGCQACRCACPEQCIDIVEDEEGFQAPKINEERCVDCGLCNARCPQNSRPDLARNDCIKVLGAKNKDDALRTKSSSGGVFAGIALKILETPGNAVFGCAFDEEIVARHICVTDAKDIAKCQGSKYVQSDVGDTYLQARALLDDGKTVFYTGTPCQIAGLYAFLGRSYDNLLTADLVCHGVPSPLLFKRYIGWLGKKLNEKITGYSFRSKEKLGWKHITKTKIKTKTRSKSIITVNDLYFNAFVTNITLRECCYTCAYSDKQRAADITLGDFWGVEVAHPGFFDSRGVSLVLINTSKGECLFKSIYSQFDVIESTLEKAWQRVLSQPSPRNKLRDIAYIHIKDESVDIFKQACFKLSARQRIKTCIRLLTPRVAVRTCKVIRNKLRRSVKL